MTFSARAGCTTQEVFPGWMVREGNHMHPHIVFYSLKTGLCMATGTMALTVTLKVKGGVKVKRGDLFVKGSAKIAGRRHTKVEDTRTVLATELSLLRIAPQVTFLHTQSADSDQDIETSSRCSQISYVSR